LSMHHFKTFL